VAWWRSSCPGRHGPAQRDARALEGLIALVGAWTIVEAFAFEGNNLEWWSFASAAALALLAAIGLGVHEMSTERVVHELTVSAGHERREPAPIS
jgi:hypothetical protein